MDPDSVLLLNSIHRVGLGIDHERTRTKRPLDHHRRTAATVARRIESNPKLRPDRCTKAYLK